MNEQYSLSSLWTQRAQEGTQRTFFSCVLIKGQNFGSMRTPPFFGYSVSIYQKRREDGNTKRCNEEGGERMNAMKITIEIGGAKREVYCFERGEDFLAVLSVRKCRGYFPLVYRCTLATILRLWWQGMLEKIGISDR